MYILKCWTIHAGNLPPAGRESADRTAPAAHRGLSVPRAEGAPDAHRLPQSSPPGATGSAGAVCAREKKLEQVAQAEKLLGELDPGRIYTYEYLCFRITNYRPGAYPDLKLTGREAGHDLRLFVEDLSDAANVPAALAGERVLTVEELAKRFSVSTKTISRWRRLGLVSRRFVVDGRKRVGFLESSVDRFVERNSDRVRRGSHFSQLSEAERTEIIRRAQRLARAGGCPADVTRRLARKTGRSPETIRYTLKQFDQEHPDLAIFPDNHGPLRPETRRKIYQQYHRGESVDALARRFCRTRASIYRIIGETRACGSASCPWTISPTTSSPRSCGTRRSSARCSVPCRPTRRR